jgi:hypothetical protein
MGLWLLPRRCTSRRIRILLTWRSLLDYLVTQHERGIGQDIPGAGRKAVVHLSGLGTAARWPVEGTAVDHSLEGMLGHRVPPVLLRLGGLGYREKG